MMYELVESEANIETGLTNANSLQHSSVAQLAQNDLLVELIGSLS